MSSKPMYCADLVDIVFWREYITNALTFELYQAMRPREWRVGECTQVQTGNSALKYNNVSSKITSTCASRPTRQKPRGVTSLTCSQHAALHVSDTTVCGQDPSADAPSQLLPLASRYRSSCHSRLPLSYCPNCKTFLISKILKNKTYLHCATSCNTTSWFSSTSQKGKGHLHYAANLTAVILLEPASGLML